MVRESRYGATGRVPDSKVSLRVESVRSALWVRLRGAPVEAPKEGIERGTYRHPEFYGKPRSRDMHYEPVGE